MVGGAVVSARLVDAAPGASSKLELSASYDFCEFEVEVAGSSGLRYEVRLRAGLFAAAMLPATCSCPDFTNRGGGPCKHIGAAWCCAVEGNFSELVELSLAAGRREAASRAPGERAAGRALVPRASIRPPAFRGPPDPLGNEHTFSNAFDVHQGWGRPAAAPTAPSGEPAGLAQAVRELRAAEAEVAGLRTELEQVRVEAATERLGKASVDFLSAADTLREWGRACRAAESYVYVACFTFDHPEVVRYLEQARGRGLTVKLMFSRKDKGITNNQGPRLQRLRGCGCEVRGHRARACMRRC